MTIPFLDFFKGVSAKLKSARTTSTPILVVPVEKPSAEKLSKTVMPNSVRTVAPRDPFQVPAGATSTIAAPRSISLEPSRNRGGIPPAVALALEPKRERTISLDVADIAANMPPGFLKPIHDDDVVRRVVLKAAEIEKGMASGKPCIPVTSIYAQAPEIFLRNVTPPENLLVALPFEKLLEQFSNAQVRADQVREQAVPQVETPFLKVTLEDNQRFGMPMEPIETSTLPPVRVEPATAEALAAAQPEPTTEERRAGAPAGAVPLRSTPEEIAAENRKSFVPPKNTPTRIPFFPNGTDAPATERVPASSGPSVPISKTAAPNLPARIPFKPSAALPPPPPPEKIDLAADKIESPKIESARIEKREESARMIVLPLRVVLENLPAFQLNGDPDHVPADVEIEFPFAKIEPQLALGRVTVTVKEFEAALPEAYADVFDPNEANTPVALPLQEVLKNLPGESLRMRDDQENVEVGEQFETPISQKAAEDAKRFAKPDAPAKSEPAPKTEPAAPVAKKEEAPPLDAKTLVTRASALPGVTACAITFTDGLSLAGNLPPELSADGLCAVAPSLLQKIETHMPETKLGRAEALTLQCENSAITFLKDANLCLTALHKTAELGADVRKQLISMLHELAQKFSKPEAAHVDH